MLYRQSPGTTKNNNKLSKQKHCQKATWNYYWIKGSSKRSDWMIKSITVEIIILFIDGL